jgi:DNA-binding beta-propeller fold protein YncE
MTKEVFLQRMIFKACFVALVLISPFASLHAAEKEVDEQEFLFYPDPPDAPRLQFLASFSTSLDVSTGKSKFRDFMFGGSDQQGHLIKKTYGLAVHEGAIHAVDTQGNGWAIFDIANGRTAVVRPEGRGALKKPVNITIDSDGTKYLTDTGREQVLVYDDNNRFVRAFGEPGQYKPADIAIINDRLYLTDVANHQVHVIDKISGDILFSFGGSGADPGQLRHPTNIAAATDGTLYVVDSTNFRVQQFSGEGELIQSFGGQGTMPGLFSRPKGISIDRDGYIYVVDSAFENVQILDQEGGALMYFGAPGYARDSINLPTVVKIDYDNVQYFRKYAAPNFELEYLVLVASQYGNNKIAVFGYGHVRE